MDDRYRPARDDALLPRLDAFARLHPTIDLRISTNNNRVDLAGEALDYAIRFGDGAWHGTHAEPIFAAPMERGRPPRRRWSRGKFCVPHFALMRAEPPLCCVKRAETVSHFEPTPHIRWEG